MEKCYCFRFSFLTELVPPTYNPRGEAVIPLHRERPRPNLFQLTLRYIFLSILLTSQKSLQHVRLQGGG